MRQLPIIMTNESVRAILAGKKTQTRRVMKTFPDVQCIKLHQHGDEWLESWSAHHIPCYRSNAWMRHKSPYRKDDLLWVREAWMYWNWTEDGDPWIKYAADGTKRLCRIPDSGDSFWEMEVSEKIGDVWAKLSDRDNFQKHGAARDNSSRNPIFMFKHFARIWLEVTDVRVEQVQDITEADAIAEGALHGVDASWDGNGAYAQGRYQFLWDMLNAKRGYPWKDNPWVWVYEFRRVG